MNIRHLPNDPSVYKAPRSYSGQALPEALARIHQIVVVSKIRDVILDFGDTTTAFEAGMLPLLPIIERYRAKHRARFRLVLPRDSKLRAIFCDANWAHFIEPKYEFRQGRSEAHCPAVRFTNAKEQFDAVDRVLAIVLSASEVDRSVLKAIEWSLNEISDNVLNHAGKSNAGFLQATWFRRQRTMEFIVSDAGVGIRQSLGEKDDMIALENCIQEGVTRNKETNQGNGLFGSYRIAHSGNGTFNIFSGNATLYLDDKGRVKVQGSRVPYKGTTVRWTVRTDAVDVIQRALVFKGRAMDTALDYMERVYEGKAGSVTIGMKARFPSMGSRTAGKSAYNYFKNILFNTDLDGIVADFTSVSIISSSFADEVFGRLFSEMGPVQFMGRVHFAHANAEILAVINRAMVQRSGMKQTD
jgi:anti-sigma regulatory factor (Ser/Thr protein kinase)